ncbi:MAG: formate--tetrahydrofolate ligase [Armatimonadetes bacterium]|nr:formate--tetrahydrofolate ligase [Armatimonadota bacterium]
MPTDLEIAQSVTPRPIVDVASELGLSPDDLELYGRDKAKISYPVLERLLAPPGLGAGGRPRGKLVVTTAITPTPAGEGKTTVTIGLAQGLCKLGKKAIAAVREPSLGPVFGMKGGAAGGGYSQVLPMEDINLHFTGDMHALGTANNLLAALTDNHIYSGNALGLDVRTIAHRRCLDMNDRALRHVVAALGGKSNGYPRETGFQITVASEVMAILCLSESLAELKERLGRIVVGQGRRGHPVTAHDLGAAGAMAALLRDAIKPNLVQTLEGTPAFVHGGPFGNIAHGCSSVLGTKLALRLGEVVVTEAGFGSDLGFEKFCDIVAAPRLPELAPDAVVLVATVRALKMHGGVAVGDLNREDVDAVRRGLPNLDRHAANVGQVGVPVVITVNKFATDTPAEIDAVLEHCRAQGWAVAVNDVWGRGGDGGRELAAAVLTAMETPGQFRPIYDAHLPIEEKIRTLAAKVYGADGVEISAEAHAQAVWLQRHGFRHLPVCVAKTQYSFSDDPARRGAPTGFTLNVRALTLSAGAGFVVALMGSILTMPGLPKRPAALDIDVDAEGRISGLF